MELMEWVTPGLVSLSDTKESLIDGAHTECQSGRAADVCFQGGGPPGAFTPRPKNENN